MPKIAIINLQTHAIETYYDDEAPNQGKFGGPWGWATHTTHVAVPPELRHDLLRAVLREDGTYGFEEDPDKVSAVRTVTWSAVRSMRNTKLTESDWTQMPDVPLSEEVKARWAVYRQALRDFPGTLTDEQVLDIGGLVWPSGP